MKKLLLSLLISCQPAMASFFIPPLSVTLPKLAADIVSPNLSGNFSLSAAVAANALTITMKDGLGNNLSSTNVARFSFRNTTLTSGLNASVSVGGNLSITIPSGATLGQTSAVNQYVWVYALNDSGTVDICVSGVGVFFNFDTNSATLISAGATSGTTLYCSLTHTGAKPTQVIGRLLVNEATAGTWASAPTRISLLPALTPNDTDYGPASTITLTAVGGGLVKGTGTVVDSVMFKRNGPMMTAWYRLSFTTAGSAGVGEYLLTIPGSQLADTTNGLTAQTTAGHALSVVGLMPSVFRCTGIGQTANGGSNFGTVENGLLYSTSQFRVTFSAGFAANQNWSATNFAMNNNNSSWNIICEIPILGWSTYGP